MCVLVSFSLFFIIIYRIFIWADITGYADIQQLRVTQLLAHLRDMRALLLLILFQFCANKR